MIIVLASKVIKRKGRPPSLRIDCEGNVHVLAEMTGKSNYYDGNLRTNTLDEIICEPSFFGCFTNQNIQKIE